MVNTLDEETNAPTGILSIPDPPPRRSRKLRFWHSPRFQTWLAITVVLLVFIGLFGGTDKGRNQLRNAHTKASSLIDSTKAPLHAPQQQDESPAIDRRQDIKHLLVAASGPSPDLCKFLLTSSTLKYPPPHLLGWNCTYDDPNLAAGGALLAKIHLTLEYLDRLSEANNDELVLLVDAQDIWFQVPPEVLEERYRDILAQADARLVTHYGRRTMREVKERNLVDLLSSRVVFAAVKHCVPNQPHTMACYAVPESPLPQDLYGGNTDSGIGFNEYSSNRQRFLNTGYVMGPVGDMRRLFRRAGVMVEGKRRLLLAAGENRNAWDKMDDTSYSSSYWYHGSDQSIFAKIFGRQSYVREVLRRKWDEDAGEEKDKQKSTFVNGVFVDDILNPSFPHEEWWMDRMWAPTERFLELQEHLDVWIAGGRQLLERYDFGITLDYFSDLGHQTIDSERDAQWLVHGDMPLTGQIDAESRSPFDCPLQLPGSSSTSSGLPDNLAHSPHPSHLDPEQDPEHAHSHWLDTPVYTHLCLSTPDEAKLPAMIHHDGDKSQRASAWHHMSWLYEAAKPLLLRHAHDEYETPDVGAGDRDDVDGLARVAEDRQGPRMGGAWIDKGFSKSWGQLCPRKMVVQGEVFGKDDARTAQRDGYDSG